MYMPRIADKELGDRLGAAGAVLIEGPRACGKTETARQQAASEVQLDVDENARQAMSIDPSLVLAGDRPRLIDEWQIEPAIWNHVRRDVDRRRSPGQYILTGSAVPADDITRHTGAGRISRIRLRTMSSFEAGFFHRPSVSVRPDARSFRGLFAPKHHAGGSRRAPEPRRLAGRPEPVGPGVHDSPHRLSGGNPSSRHCPGRWRFPESGQRRPRPAIARAKRGHTGQRAHHRRGRRRGRRPVGRGHRAQLPRCPAAVDGVRRAAGVVATASLQVPAAALAETPLRRSVVGCRGPRRNAVTVVGGPQLPGSAVRIHGVSGSFHLFPCLRRERLSLPRQHQPRSRRLGAETVKETGAPSR